MTRLIKSEYMAVSIYLESEYIEFIVEDEIENLSRIRKILENIEDEILNF